MVVTTRHRSGPSHPTLRIAGISTTVITKGKGKNKNEAPADSRYLLNCYNRMFINRMFILPAKSRYLLRCYNALAEHIRHWNPADSRYFMVVTITFRRSGSLSCI